MTHGLTGPDWALFKEENKKKLVKCLVEETVEGSCTRLTKYLNIAKEVLTTFQKIDALYTLPNPRTYKLANNEDLRVQITAKMIQHQDLEIAGILDSLNMPSTDSEVYIMCERFARVVIKHENDSDCTNILGELTKVGF